ncbi:hypothetical protein BVRB_9g223750 [Beta vulgaris subsp. vulgaris]|nr:hypothetical protein BVRB_9g223750 [Beta vulgaris subsp. vulgaris]
MINTLDCASMLYQERARNNCLFLANTLSSAMEVADCLNKIISVILISATFILWLLLTRLASTKVLVLIASPLLAATFVFGDTCKILFQGVFFVYAIHPFDVSDLCVIDGTMMEVRTIGIWKTTFTKVGTQEKVIYPNSELSKKNIINHKSDFDWNDYIEFDVDSMKDEKLKILKQEIEKHLEGNKDKFAPSYSWVVVTTNDTIKIAVYIRHIVHLQNSTNFECLKVKHKLRSDFVLYVKNLMDQ